MINWGPFQNQYLHPIQVTASLDQKWQRNERMRQKTSFRDRIIYYWTHKEPSTGYSKKKADFPVFESDTAKILQRKSNRDTCSSVERMADGDQKQKVVHPARRMEGHVPRSPSEGPFDETTLDVDEIEVKENHWSLERSQDRCGALDPFQACPDGRRAHACS